MSLETENVTGNIRWFEPEHLDASLSKRLLFPIPQSPRIAKEAILPVLALDWSESANVSRCTWRPMNSSGFTGKFGSGSTGTSNSQKLTILNVELCEFCEFREFRSISICDCWWGHNGR